MRYLCVHCDERFEHDAESSPRCPSCMRVHGIEAVKGGPVPVSGARRWFMPAAAIGTLLVVASGFAAWRFAGPGSLPETVPLRALSDSELGVYLERAGIPPQEQLKLRATGTAIAQLAAKAGDGDDLAKAKAVVAAIRARAEAGAFVSMPVEEPREDPLKTPEESAALLQQESRAALYPFEVSSAAIFALRHAGVDAVFVAAYAFPGDDAPPDPSGHMGYHLVGIWKGEAGQGRPDFLDPWAGREVPPEEGQYRVLTDVEALGVAINIGAIQRGLRKGETRQAVSDSALALRLAPQLPTVRAVRGTVLLASGGLEEGIRELEAAAQLRDDAVRRRFLAEVYRARGDRERGMRFITSALQDAPGYAAAHGTLAAMHMDSRDMDEAKREIEVASRLDPHLPQLDQLWAQFYVSTGETERALSFAEKGVARRPHDVQARLLLAAIYRAAARYDDMRREVRTVMELTPKVRQGEMKQVVAQMLGPTAFEEPLDDSSTGDDDSSATGELKLDSDLALPDDLDLSKGSKLLGDGSGSAGTDTKLRLGDSDGYKLRGSKQKLQLQMGN